MLCERIKKRIPKQAWEWTAPGSRSRGRPRNTLKRTIRDEMRSGNIMDVRLSEKAQDRQGWRALLSALCTRRYWRRLSKYVL